MKVIEAKGAAIQVSVLPDTKTSPFIIENYTKYPIPFAQKGALGWSEQLPSKYRVDFAWGT